MVKPNKRTVIILFIGIFIFLIRQAYAAEGSIIDESQGVNKIEYKSEDLRDPFEKEQPKGQIETNLLPSLQVQGIVWGGSFPQAIINNKVLRVGDTIEGVRITNITKDSVTVFFGNRQYNLSTSSPISSQGFKQGQSPGQPGFRQNQPAQQSFNKKNP